MFDDWNFKNLNLIIGLVIFFCWDCMEIRFYYYFLENIFKFLGKILCFEVYYKNVFD